MKLTSVSAERLVAFQDGFCSMDFFKIKLTHVESHQLETRWNMKLNIVRTTTEMYVERDFTCVLKTCKKLV
jgi:hypothetical protein